MNFKNADFREFKFKLKDESKLRISERLARQQGGCAGHEIATPITVSATATQLGNGNLSNTRLFPKCEQQSPPPDMGNLVYVCEWFDNNSKILGYGMNQYGHACYLQPNIDPGLFVTTRDLEILTEFCRVQQLDFIVYHGITYQSNNYTLWDMINECGVEDAPTVLVKILTKTVVEAKQLHDRFSYDNLSYKYVNINRYFNVSKQIMFELVVRKISQQLMSGGDLDYSIPKTILVWMDDNLQIYDNLPDPIIPQVIYDIETVSDDPHRVPMGDHCMDILYTASIYHSHTKLLYSLVYLPIQNVDSQTLYRRILDDGYDMTSEQSTGDDTESRNILEVYTNEPDLLRRTMELLTLKPLLHIKYGYNTEGYDIVYLMTRCHYYNIHIDEFIYRNKFSFGVEQMHMDMFRIILMRYRFKSYKLNDVSREIIKDSKTGINAVNLRYTFFRMLKENRYLEHSESSEQFPSIRDTIYYNNVDTLLINRLEMRTKCIPFLFGMADKLKVSWSELTSAGIANKHSGMEFKLLNECFTTALGMRIFLTTFKEHNVALQLTCMPMSVYGADDKLNSVFRIDDKMNGENINDEGVVVSRRGGKKKESSKFPGGANYCLGEFNVNNVQMYDYVTAYTILISNKNISDETTTIMPAGVLLALYDKLVHRLNEFRFYDYMTHNGNTTAETVILYNQYVNENRYCGGEFEFTENELRRRNDDLVIVIWEKRCSVLSQICKRFNENRANTKIRRKILDGVLEMIEEQIVKLDSDRLMMQMMIQRNAEMAEQRLLLQQQQQQQKQQQQTGEMDQDLDFGGSDDSDDDNDDDDTAAAANSKNNNDDDDCFGMAESSGGDDSDSDADDNMDFGINDNDDDDAASNMDFGGCDDCSDDEQAEEDSSSNNIGNSKTKTPPIAASCAAATAAAAATTTTIDNPFNFDFCNKYITVYANQLCSINVDRLNVDTNRDTAAIINILRDIASNVSLERDKEQNSYEIQKSLVSSIFGCIGRISPVLGATITCLTRTSLLQSAQYTRKRGRQILYIDTDSIMTVGGDGSDMSNELNSVFPYMLMEMKVARKCMFVRRKVYYKWENDIMKYGQNVNGPTSWRDCVLYFADHTNIATLDDVKQLFVDFFSSIYESVRSRSQIDDDLIASVTKSLQVQESYKTSTPTEKYKTYMQQNYPELAGNFKHTVYYMISCSLTAPTFRPALELQDLDDIRYVNLFMYYKNMFTTLYNLIKFNVAHKNQPHFISIAKNSVLQMMLSGFITAYTRMYGGGSLDMLNPSAAVSNAGLLDGDFDNDEFFESSTAITTASPTTAADDDDAANNEEDYVDDRAVEAPPEDLEI